MTVRAVTQGARSSSRIHHRGFPKASGDGGALQTERGAGRGIALNADTRNSDVMSLHGEGRPSSQPSGLHASTRPQRWSNSLQASADGASADSSEGMRVPQPDTW